MATKNRSNESVALSGSWLEHFQANRAKADQLPWGDVYRITPSERRTIEESVRQFQLGEGAQGKRLQARGRAYAEATGDWLFPEVLALFIGEEQRHSGELLRFMQLQGIAAVEKHWVDSVFRCVRVLAGLELELRVLATAEVIAIPYYRALGCATQSTLLRSISAKILEDEATHLRFQASMLATLEDGRPWLSRELIWRAHRWFLVGTCCVVWIEHRSVFRAAGRRFYDLLLDAILEFSGLKQATRSPSWPRSISGGAGPEIPDREVASANHLSAALAAPPEGRASRLP